MHSIPPRENCRCRCANSASTFSRIVQCSSMARRSIRCCHRVCWRISFPSSCSVIQSQICCRSRREPNFEKSTPSNTSDSEFKRLWKRQLPSVFVVSVIYFKFISYKRKFLVTQIASFQFVSYHKTLISKEKLFNHNGASLGSSRRRNVSHILDSSLRRSSLD